MLYKVRLSQSINLDSINFICQNTFTVHSSESSEHVWLGIQIIISCFYTGFLSRYSDAIIDPNRQKLDTK